MEQLIKELESKVVKGGNGDEESKKKFKLM